MARMASNERKWRSDCPINIFLELFGDRWTLLIVRDLLIKGRTRFGEFLQGGEGIASNILTDRLGRLETHGILERHRDLTDHRRFSYRLTAKGVALAPVLYETILWAARHEETAAPADEIKAMDSDRAAYLEQVRQRWAELESQPR